MNRLIYTQRSYKLYIFTKIPNLWGLSEGFWPIHSVLRLSTSRLFRICNLSWYKELRPYKQNLSLISVKDIYALFVSMTTSPFPLYLTSTPSWMKLYLLLFRSSNTYSLNIITDVGTRESTSCIDIELTILFSTSIISACEFVLHLLGQNFYNSKHSYSWLGPWIIHTYIIQSYFNVWKLLSVLRL